MIMTNNNNPIPHSTYINYLGESIKLEDIIKLGGAQCEKNRRPLEIVVHTKHRCHVIQFTTLEEAQDQRVALTHYLESRNNY